MVRPSFVRLLLDTHIWIWSLLDRRRLSPRLLRVLATPGHEIWLSSISVWELCVLVERGRLALDREVEAWVRQSFALAPLQEAPITQDIALASRLVDPALSDPADRLLVATARVLDLTLVTADRGMARTRSVSVLENR
jgi:PIN domain nuclease of toxin-antitoxin system